MKRREFITLLGGAAAWPVTARAQQPAMPVIGVLNATSPTGAAEFLSGVRHGLAETGFVEGRNLAIESRFADNQYDQLPALATELVRRNVAVIVGNPATATVAAKAATTTIPIVFIIGGDPVEQLGLVNSYSRPGGNITGVTSFTAELWSKRLGLMRELAPAATAIAILLNPKAAGADRATKDTQAASHTLGWQVLFWKASTSQEIDAAFATIEQQRPGVLGVQADPFLDSHRDQIVALAARYSIPASYPNPEDSVVGGLIAYGVSRANRVDLNRQVGIYVGRILKGEKPGDLPVLQPTKYELVINLNTAKALKLTIPSGILAIADEVIE
jgi:putative ABC transport system substrate-binding protein